MPCMMLENWSFRRDNLAVLNMIRQGLFGEIVHCHCAHSHDCIDHWFFDPRGQHALGGQVPHQAQPRPVPDPRLGPVLSWMDINCGDAFDYLTSTATASSASTTTSRASSAPTTPTPSAAYAQGDIVTTRGPDEEGQDHRHQLRHAAAPALRQPLDDPGHAGPLQRAARRRLPRRPQPRSTTSGSRSRPTRRSTTTPGGRTMQGPGRGGRPRRHGLPRAGAVRRGGPRKKTQTPIDVYDSVTDERHHRRSRRSRSPRGSAPVECPDFTRGKWKTRQPTFAVEG